VEIMTDMDELRKKRIARDKNEGPKKFIAKFGIPFSLLFRPFILFVSRLRTSKYTLLFLLLVGGLIFETCLWLFMLFKFK